MIGQGAVDFVQLLFAFDIYFDGCAGIVALAALTGGDVVGFGIGRVLADGGRVLTVCGTGADLASARGVAYAAVAAVDWSDGFYRRDIAARAAV